MSVNNGQDANQDTFNNAFLSRTTDSDTTAKIDLNNADVASGVAIVNIQREFNKVNSFLGSAANSAKDTKPTWTSTAVGTPADDIKTRTENLTAKFEAAGHAHTGAAGDGGPISSGDLVDTTLSAYWQSQTATMGGSPATTLDVSTPMSGVPISSGITVEGVGVTNPGNLCQIRNGASAEIYNYIRDANNAPVYGRLTNSGGPSGTWTLSFYSIIAGVETAFSMPASTQVIFYYQELFNPNSTDAPPPVRHTLKVFEMLLSKAASAGATTALSNLTATAINANLIPDTNDALDLGDPTLLWRALYIHYLSDSSSSIVMDVLARTLNDSSDAPVIDWSGTDIDVTSHKIINLADPTNAQDAATKTYVDSTAGSNQSYELSNLAIGASVAGNALTVALKTKAGTDPSGSDIVKIGFRSSTLTSGIYNQRTVSSSLSMTVSSGSTLGHSNGNLRYIYVYAIDNAGTVELAVSSALFSDGHLVSTTAEGGAGAADSGRVMYSTTARTNVPCRLIGRISSTQATAGTWASAPSEINLIPFHKVPVSAAYTLSGDVSVSSATNTDVVWNSKLEDPYDIMNTSTGEITIPETGLWKVDAIILWNTSGSTSTGSMEADLFVNGSAQLPGGSITMGNHNVAVYLQNTLSRTRSYNAGDVLKVVAYQSGNGASINIQGSGVKSSIHISRVDYQ